MSNSEIENRIALLEKEVASLKQKIEKDTEKKEPWWKQRIGVFADDAAHEEAIRLGREYRLSQREDYDLNEEE